MCWSHYTVVTASKKNCFQESFKVIKTVRISQFVRQRVSDCWASVIKSPPVRTGRGKQVWYTEKETIRHDNYRRKYFTVDGPQRP